MSKLKVMAIVFDNLLTLGLRGKFGELMVFRRVRGKTILSHAPTKPDKSKESTAQRLTRTTFKEASRLAKIAVLDPEKKKYYMERAKEWNLTNAYTAAVKDFMSNKEDVLPKSS
jgi:hypothetical protein